MFDWLTPHYEMDGDIGASSGVESVPAAEVQGDTSGDDGQAAAEPNNFEKAFAKRLSAEREKWQSETNEKYKDYDSHKAISDYFAQTHGLDVMTLKERIEYERLQDRAMEANVPPEVLKRLDELEEKSARADALEQFQQEQQIRAEFETNIKAFAEEKGTDYKELWKFMHENQLSNMDIAFKAMRADQLEAEKQSAEKEGMKKLIQAKGSIPTVAGSNAQGQVHSGPPKTFAEARARAMQRLS